MFYVKTPLHSHSGEMLDGCSQWSVTAAGLVLGVLWGLSCISRCSSPLASFGVCQPVLQGLVRPLQSPKTNQVTKTNQEVVPDFLLCLPQQCQFQRQADFGFPSVLSLSPNLSPAHHFCCGSHLSLHRTLRFILSCPLGSW